MLVLLSTLHAMLFTTLGYPVTKVFPYETLPNPPKWSDHCRETSNPNSNSNNSLSLEIKSLFNNVMRSAKIANKRGNDTKQKLVKEKFEDREFEETVKIFGKIEWLPKIPLASEETLGNITPVNAFFKAHEYIQFFAVGIEQIILDQEVYDGSMKEEFKAIAEDNYKILCEINIGMHLQRLKPNLNISRAAMSHEYRVMDLYSRRNLRDYLILRDYVNATNFITILFSYHANKL